MSVKDKMVNRLLSMPSDYTFIELCGLASKLGCSISQDGNGSRCSIVCNSGAKLCFHKPHGYGYFKKYAIKDFINFFQSEGLI